MLMRLFLISYAHAGRAAKKPEARQK